MASLAGEGYPEGIPIHPEEELRQLIRDERVDLVAFSYSDVPHAEVMHKASITLVREAAKKLGYRDTRNPTVGEPSISTSATVPPSRPSWP